ncbi:dihydrofolate reductase family protein [Planobispora siamensis]|uniref:Bacterial bifunctional deaminase-reductase C-terminal domain-containing protein n=1 Tax=Planobispora siamensis TaxID=936338 RepID=A0A8J3SMS0_9ACTN|nr:dihydrofolate reductase family protein [Planobispora siamensis]GIH97313.1 hypothetical protein Psi01_79430 [Planobispora siamensis]
MRKLIESTFVTLDGVIDSPEQWGSPYWDEEHAGYAGALFSECDALKYGTGELDRTLLENTLVDEYHFWMFPVVAGGGRRLFEGIDTTHLRLVRSVPFASGIVVLVYEPKR